MKEIFANTAQTTLNGGITDVAVSLVVASATGFPVLTTDQQFRIKIDSEYLLVTATSGTTWTVTREGEGSTGVAHSSGAVVTQVLTAGALTDGGFANEFLITSDGPFLGLLNTAFSTDPDAGTAFSFEQDTIGDCLISTPTGQRLSIQHQSDCYLLFEDSADPAITVQTAGTTLRFGVEVTSETLSGENMQGYYHESTLTLTNQANRYAFASEWHYGKAGSAAHGLLTTYSGQIFVEATDNATNEYVFAAGGINYMIGTGFTQSGAPAGSSWLFDLEICGPIAVQPYKINGEVTMIGNYYNGSPSGGEAAAKFLLTDYGDLGAIRDATHKAADTYPVDNALVIAGKSHYSSADHIGFTTGIRIGGAAAPYGMATSIVGTGIHIRDHATCGILIDNPSGTPTADIEATGLIKAARMQIPEVAFASLPGAPAVGEEANVNNSNTATWGATVAAGGTNHVSARWNGSVWTVVGK